MMRRAALALLFLCALAGTRAQIAPATYFIRFTDKANTPYSIAAPQAQRRMAERIPGAGYREFEGGHLFFVQDARAAEEIIAALAPAPDQQNVMPPAQPGAVSPADGADDTATRRA